MPLIFRARIEPASKRRGTVSPIYIVEADGTGLRRVTNHPERDDFAVWHPDGRRLVMVAQRGGKYDLALIDVNELLAE